MKNVKNATLITLIGLQKQGVQLHLTEDGWKVFLNLMNEDIERGINEVVTEDLNVG